MKSSSSTKKNNSPKDLLLNRFQKDFLFRIAIDEKDRMDAFRLRYQVYCEELGYEEPADVARGLEYDVHDSNSIQCLINHRRSGIPAGCMRLVLPRHDNHCSFSRLPLQNYAGQSLTHSRYHPMLLDEDSICEVSRLAISPLFRNRSTNAEIAESIKARHPFSDDERRSFPAIIIGLFLATYALVGMTNRRHVFAMMEPRLPRLLSMSGFNFTQVGESINFHGKRSAFYIDQRKAEKEMHQDLMPLYMHIKKALAPQLEKLLMHEARAYCS
jgi:N-acyl amino acid synthase of PEP-CTERM/exosortase system